MCSMGSPRQRRDVTHDGAGVCTRTRLEHTHTHGDSHPHVRVHPHPKCSPPHPLEGVPKFRGWMGAEPAPPHIRVRKRMCKREEEGGFHSNRLVSRETWREMSAQSWGWSREGIESPRVMGWHRVAPRDTSQCHPLCHWSPETSPLCQGRIWLTPNSGGCDSTETPNPEPRCPSHPCHGQEEETPFWGGAAPLH